MGFRIYQPVSLYYIWLTNPNHIKQGDKQMFNASPLSVPVDNVHSLPDPGGVVNTNEAFCTVVQTRLADHRLLFSGEVDCRDKDPNAPAPPASYVELKTSAEICTPKQRSNFHR